MSRGAPPPISFVLLRSRGRASGGGTVTRLRTVSFGNAGGNQVVQLPPVRVANASGGGKAGIWWRNGDPVANGAVWQRRRQPGRPTHHSSGCNLRKEKRGSGGGTVTWLRTVPWQRGGNQVVQLPPVRVAMPRGGKAGVWWRNGDPVANGVVWQRRRQPGRPTTTRSSRMAPAQLGRGRTHSGPRRPTAPRPTKVSHDLVKNCDQPPGRVVCPTSIRWPSGSRI